MRRWQTWIRVLGAALLAALLSAPAAAAPATSAAPATQTQAAFSGEIGVVGDSLTVGSATQLRNELAIRGLTARISAQSGRSIPGGVTAVQELRASGFDSLVWVVALGTNDIWWDAGCGCGITTSTAAGRIQTMLDAIGPGRHVYWVNVNRLDIPQAVSVFNQALLQAAAGRASLRVIDFHSLSAANMSWFANDGVHLSSTGYAQRALQVATAAATSPALNLNRPFPVQLSGDAAPAPGGVASRGDRGDQVRAVQQALVTRGFLGTGSADGIFGAGTEGAVKAFQRSIGLRATGIVTDKTAAALGVRR